MGKAAMVETKTESKELISVPMKRTDRNVIHHIGIQLPHSHAQALRDLFDGLYEKKAKLKSGKFVERPQQAMLWLLENLQDCKLPNFQP